MSKEPYVVTGHNGATERGYTALMRQNILGTERSIRRRRDEELHVFDSRGNLMQSIQGKGAEVKFDGTLPENSILTHNLEERNKEMEAMASNKVANYDPYTMVGDKWEEETYKAFRRILTDEQWKKYLKSGAGRAKKARDQRAAKREGTK